jgi:hypothetical protein
MRVLPSRCFFHHAYPKLPLFHRRRTLRRILMSLEDQVTAIAATVTNIEQTLGTLTAPENNSAALATLQTGVTALLAQLNLNPDGTPMTAAPAPAATPSPAPDSAA